MDQLLYVLIGVSYVVGPLFLGVMGYVGWRLIQDQRRQKRRERP